MGSVSSSLSCAPPLTDLGIDASVRAYYNSLGFAERAQFTETLSGPDREAFQQLQQLPPVDAQGVHAQEGVAVSLGPAVAELPLAGAPDRQPPFGDSAPQTQVVTQPPQSDTAPQSDTGMSDFPGEDLKQACGEDWCIKTCGCVSCVVILLIVVLVPCSLDKVSSEQAAIGYICHSPPMTACDLLQRLLRSYDMCVLFCHIGRSLLTLTHTSFRYDNLQSILKTDVLMEGLQTKPTFGINMYVYPRSV